MRVLDLFSGVGGFAVGLERAGFQTVAFCEIEPFPRAVLAKHWPQVPCYDDVRSLTAEHLAADGIVPDVICGGFPCQDISIAGKGAGLAGERSGLWREYARLIEEIRPRWVIVENVPALRSRGLDEVLGSLAAIGYDAEWHCIPAAAIGAPHQRDRVWIVAYPNGAGCGDSSQMRAGCGQSGEGKRVDTAAGGGCDYVAHAEQIGRGGFAHIASGHDGDGHAAGRQEGAGWVGQCSENVAHATVGGWREHGYERGQVGDAGAGQSADSRQDVAHGGSTGLPSTKRAGWPEPVITAADVRRAASERRWGRVAPGMDGEASRLPRRVDGTRPVEAWEGNTPRVVGRGYPNRRPRLKALGNSVVPQVVELIGRAIMRRETEIAEALNAA